MFYACVCMRLVCVCVCVCESVCVSMCAFAHVCRNKTKHKTDQKSIKLEKMNLFRIQRHRN
jgi:hypothetical protein